MHNIVQNKTRKTLVATLTGNIDINQANAMLSDFKKIIDGLNTKDYVLIINPENITANIFVIPILQSFINLVAELKFKRIYLINTDKYAALIKQQLGNTDVAASIKFAANVNEALNNC